MRTSSITSRHAYSLSQGSLKLKSRLKARELNPKWDLKQLNQRIIDGKPIPKKLDVSYSTIGSNRDDNRGIDALCKLIENNAPIEHLVLNFCKINIDSRIQRLAEALANNTAIQKIDLHGNRIGLSGIQMLIKALNSNQNIQVRINSQIPKNVAISEQNASRQAQNELSASQHRLIIDDAVYSNNQYSCDYDYEHRPEIEHKPFIQELFFENA